MKNLIQWSLPLILVTLIGCQGPSGSAGGENGIGGEGLNLLLLDSVSNSQSNSIPETNDAIVQVFLGDEDGEPIIGEIVNLTVVVGGALLSQSSVLTDSKGQANVFLYSPDVVSGSQPGSIVATAGGVTSDPLNFEFTASNVVDPSAVITGIQLVITEASTGDVKTSISTDDVANVAIQLFDNDGNVLANEIVTLEATSGVLSQTTVLTDATGSASVTINPPEDLLFGTAPGTITATTDVLDKPEYQNYEFNATTQISDGDSTFATSIRFDSVSEEIISLKGTGTVGFGESSLVNFTVFNGTQTVANAEVNFVLTTSVGGIQFDTDGDGNGDFTNTTAVSDAQGRVSVLVHSGNIATPVRVTAFIDLENGETIFVQSNVLTITTGIPDQNSMTLTFSKFVSEGADYAGDEIEVTAFLGDRFNNPVPDGTAVNFTTEGGLIQPSCTTLNSQCSVTWRSQNPVPDDHRSTVLAHAIGHETYYDRNGSGIFDNGDEFDDLSEAFRDDDENGVFDPGASNTSRDEIFVDYDGSGDYSGPDAKFNGVPCNHDADCPIDANNLANRPNSLMDVRKQGLIIMADSVASVSIRSINTGATSCLGADGKYLTDGTCSSLSNIAFGTGASTMKLWVLIEDSKALCTTGAPDYSIVPYFTRVDAVDPDSAACPYATRQSVSTGSSVSVNTTVGELSDIPINTIQNTYSAQEFVFFISSSADNEDDEAGALTVEVTSPVTGSVGSVSISVTDPAN